MNYVESDDDDEDEDEEPFRPIANNARKGRATKRRKVSIEEESDDEFGLDAATQEAMLEDGRSPGLACQDSG